MLHNTWRSSNRTTTNPANGQFGNNPDNPASNCSNDSNDFSDSNTAYYSADCPYSPSMESNSTNHCSNPANSRISMKLRTSILRLRANDWLELLDLRLPPNTVLLMFSNPADTTVPANLPTGLPTQLRIELRNMQHWMLHNLLFNVHWFSFPSGSEWLRLVSFQMSPDSRIQNCGLFFAGKLLLPYLVNCVARITSVKMSRGVVSPFSAIRYSNCEFYILDPVLGSREHVRFLELSVL